ncbi:hypothetical protein [uncultured Clostridium sp.]|uniref:hypothetical protein n=1 Tax=uncultured Clostridium sp. TaxID=59620 RepID=UPI00262529E3|nr:hypothetical protein [uncultured Clostridium sp.]
MGSKEGKEKKKRGFKDISKLEMSKNEKILIGIAIVGIVGFGTYTFMLKSMLEKIELLKAEVSMLQTSVDSRKNIDEELIEGRAILAKKEKEYSQAIIKVPETNRYPELSRKLHKAAFNSNVEIKSTSFGQPVAINYGEENSENIEGNEDEKAYKDLREAKNGFYKYTVTVKFEGAFMHVLNFIKAMERQEQILQVTNISIEKEQRVKKIDNTKEIEELERKVDTKNKLIESLMEKREEEIDTLTKLEIQDEIRNQQIERENLKDRIKELKERSIEGEKYSVISGEIVFDYYTKGEQEIENHNFNNGKYGKKDILE